MLMADHRGANGPSRKPGAELAGNSCAYTRGEVQVTHEVGGKLRAWPCDEGELHLRARPVFHHQREAIEARLTVVFAALAVRPYLQNWSGVSIKKLVQTLRAARSATIDINGQHLTIDSELTPTARALLRRFQEGH
jgi:hypothetical protein